MKPLVWKPLSVVACRGQTRSHVSPECRCMPAPTPLLPRSRSLRRDAQSLSQVLQRTGWVYQATPASLFDSDVGAAGLLRSTGVTPLHRYCKPSRHRLVFGRFPGVSGYTTYLAPPISRAGRGRFLQLLDMFLSPCCPCQISPVGSHSFLLDRGPLSSRRAYRSPVCFPSS